MDSTILAGLITGIATILATLIGVYLTPVIAAKKYRSKYDIPDIVATWQAKWFVNGELYVEDVVEIVSWHKKSHFRGAGRSSKGTYTLLGQIDSSRVAVGTYEDDKYPTKGLIGTFVLELSMDAQRFSGYWNGRTVEGALQTGTTEWKRVGK